VSARDERLSWLRIDAGEALEFIRALRMAWEMGTDPDCIAQQLTQQAREALPRTIELHRYAGCGDPAIAEIMALDSEASGERMNLLLDMQKHGMKARPAPTLEDMRDHALRTIERGQADRYLMLEASIRQMEREGDHKGAARVRMNLDRIKSVSARITRSSPTPARSPRPPTKPEVPEEVRELGALFSAAVRAS
jgi:hypothetical protein